MLVLLFAILGGGITYKLSILRWMNAIRASSTCTLICYVLLAYTAGTETANTYTSIFFGGSFVGMTSSHRLSSKGVVAAACLFGVISSLLLPFLEGVGGALGVCAFISVSAVHLTKMAATRLSINIRKP
ncbi:hypothetical protein [Alteromonas sp.]|mgnify:CR=1 FL=1|uniref:hypothetical protein n=1 Tax=Alteromonas sp. TaxID=232 RepID=UPI000B65EA83|nr:hypothetical protein [Alteromonas sp.]MAI36058.1 hypothetical protein [Alteromonas sp.]OUX92316.1 MAG: hypothetical protein CBB95_00585 [Alteromonas sp. TMED35]